MCLRIIYLCICWIIKCFNHHPSFLPQCEQPSFTPIHSNRQSYISVYFNLDISGQQTGRQKILHRTIARIAWLQSSLNFFMTWILICQCRSQIFGLFHPFEGIIIYLYIVICPASCSRGIAIIQSNQFMRYLVYSVRPPVVPINSSLLITTFHCQFINTN